MITSEIFIYAEQNTTEIWKSIKIIEFGVRFPEKFY